MDMVERRFAEATACETVHGQRHECVNVNRKPIDLQGITKRVNGVRALLTVIIVNFCDTVWN